MGPRLSEFRLGNKKRGALLPKSHSASFERMAWQRQQTPAPPVSPGSCDRLRLRRNREPPRHGSETGPDGGNSQIDSDPKLEEV